MHFINAKHHGEFTRLQSLKAFAHTTCDYSDYCYAYYILTSDVYLRSFLKRFLDENTGDIEWSIILEPNLVIEEYRQVVAFAHQLYSAAWKNENFNFVRLLDDICGKPELLQVVLEACKLYSQKFF